jgi:hypothetical protein
MMVFQGWPGLYVFKKRLYLPELPNSHFSSIYSPFTVAYFFSISLASYWCQPDSIVTSEHHVFVFITSLKLFQRRRLSQGSQFLSPLLPLSPLSNSPRVDKYYHAVGWSLTVSHVSSFESLGVCSNHIGVTSVGCHSSGHPRTSANVFAAAMDGCVCSPFIVLDGPPRSHLHPQFLFYPVSIHRCENMC